MNLVRHRAVTRVRRWALGVCAIPFTYAALGLLALTAPNFEVFPFFSWFLFPVAPTSVTRFAVQTEYGTPNVGDVPWFEQDERLGATRHSMDAQVLIQGLGAAFEHGDSAAVQHFRSTFERNFLPRSCRYRLMRRTYDPLTVWLGQNRGRAELVAVFVCGQP